MSRLSRNPRFFVIVLILFLSCYALFTAWQNSLPDSRNTAQGLLDKAQPVASSFDAVVVGNTSDLSGSLFFVEQRAQPYYRIARMDFSTRAITTAFSVPNEALVYQIARGANADELLMTYSAPTTANQMPYDRNGVYALDLKTGAPSLLFGADKQNIYYAYPEQAGDNIYYVIYERGMSTRRIEAYNRTTRAVTVVADGATLPAPSPDGKSVAWLSLKPETQVRALWVRASGAPIQLVSETTFADVDAPMFSADNKWVYFSVTEGQAPKGTSYSSWSGVRLASAHGDHNLPARWYRIAVTGGNAEAVTTDPMVIRSGAFNKEMLGFVSDTGFYVMRAHSAEEIIRSRALGSFVWSP